MRKNWQILKITFEEYFEYRLNFLLWRFRNFVSFLTLVIFWLAFYGKREVILNYQKNQLLTYAIGVAFLRGLVLASRSVDLAGQIRSGELTKLLLRPLNVFRFWFLRDLADKFLNLLFSVFEIAVVAKIINLSIILPRSLTTYPLFLILITISFFLYFYLSFFLSITAFWTEDVWATRWLFGVIFLELFAGLYFPLDILPTWLTKFIYLTPFPYLVFYPLKIWLEQIPVTQAVNVILICFFWLIFFFGLSRFIWSKGAKNYGAYGG